MKKLVPIISFLGLALVILPACLYLAGAMDKPQIKILMLIGTALWFISAPLWIGRNKT
ncbi:MAG: hypothetical protein PVF46_06935 [Lysobacterales bacterium]|jgi:hypothetical protein